jgi:hypothetical protein
MSIVSETVERIAGSPRVQEVIYVSVNPATSDSMAWLWSLLCVAMVASIMLFYLAGRRRK